MELLKSVLIYFLSSFRAFSLIAIHCLVSKRLNCDFISQNSPRIIFRVLSFHFLVSLAGNPSVVFSPSIRVLVPYSQIFPPRVSPSFKLSLIFRLSFSKKQEAMREVRAKQRPKALPAFSEWQMKKNFSLFLLRELVYLNIERVLKLPEFIVTLSRVLL